FFRERERCAHARRRRTITIAQPLACSASKPRAVCAPIRLGGSARLHSVDDDGAGAQAIEAVRRRHESGHHDAVPVNAAQAARLRAVAGTPNCALDRLDAARFAALRIDDVDISVAVALGIDINVAFTFTLDIDIDATRRETRRDDSIRQSRAFSSK
ncbi:hypothetical protein, partial [Burkholderia pseudomallei]